MSNAWLELRAAEAVLWLLIVFAPLEPFQPFSSIIDFLRASSLVTHSYAIELRAKTALLCLSYVFGSSTGNRLVPALHTVCKNSPDRHAAVKASTNPSDQSQLRMLSLFCRVLAAHLMIAKSLYLTFQRRRLQKRFFIVNQLFPFTFG
jgi:hypothetical protein